MRCCIKLMKKEKKLRKEMGGVYCIHSISQYLATNSYSKDQHGAKGENEVVNIAVFSSFNYVK